MAEVRQLRLGGPEAPGAARELVAALAEDAYQDEVLAEYLRLVVSEDTILKAESVSVASSTLRTGQEGRTRISRPPRASI